MCISIRFGEKKKSASLTKGLAFETRQFWDIP
jgi:hypothetical protein